MSLLQDFPFQSIVARLRGQFTVELFRVPWPERSTAQRNTGGRCLRTVQRTVRFAVGCEKGSQWACGMR